VGAGLGPGLATSDELWRQLSLEAKTDTFVGWMTWVPRAHGAVRQLPDPAQVEEVDDKGSLVILTPELLRSDNPEHLALARRVQQSLKARGLLRQLREPGPPPGG
jgi:Immunity protein 52